MGRRAVRLVIFAAVTGCFVDRDSDSRPDSSTTLVGTARDTVSACFAGNGSVLSRAATSNGWLRLEQFRSDSATAKLVDADGFALDADWRRVIDSIFIAGFNDFVRIEMRLLLRDSGGRGTLSARSDAALERDSAGGLREFSRTSTIEFRRASCDSMPHEAGTAAIDVLPQGSPRPGLRFDPLAIKAGHALGVLVLDSIHARQAVVDSSYVGTARFRGLIELSGWTMRHPDPDAYHVLTCFEADSASAARLPRWSGDERRAWFCFSNRQEAALALGPPSEGVTATIVIDQFTINRGLSDEVNSARFVRRVKR